MVECFGRVSAPFIRKMPSQLARNYKHLEQREVLQKRFEALLVPTVGSKRTEARTIVVE